ncbi:MAG: MFS transporter, partial [Dehalococcoidia bacterium]|nr:MFS transporter [Dehalococcoidia bacterium]
MPRPTLSDDEVESGMKWLTWEGAATMGYSSITESGFLTAYALLMGANNFQIGLLAALPFLIQPTQ